MPRTSNQKLKLLYLADILLTETDEDHPLTLREIISKLKGFDISADRKTLYQDFEVLREYGYDIISEKRGRSCCYFLGERSFELPELKLLVDSVQSAKFITDKKSGALIKKLESLTSRHLAKQLNRQVVISGRVKTMNESIYYNVDRLHEAINCDRQITFNYFQWNIKKEQELRHDGKLYKVSPWGLMWDDENYYLVAYDAEEEIIKHFRVDKMLKINISEDKRKGKSCFKDFDLPRYTKSIFGMFGGTPERVTFEAADHMAGVMIDRFGKDLTIIPSGKDRFKASVNVLVSPQFLAWMISLGRDVRITAPANVVDMMRDEIKRLNEMYM